LSSSVRRRICPDPLRRNLTQPTDHTRTPENRRSCPAVKSYPNSSRSSRPRNSDANESPKPTAAKLRNSIHGSRPSTPILGGDRGDPRRTIAPRVRRENGPHATEAVARDDVPSTRSPGGVPASSQSPHYNCEQKLPPARFRANSTLVELRRPTPRLRWLGSRRFGWDHGRDFGPIHPEPRDSRLTSALTIGRATRPIAPGRSPARSVGLRKSAAA
jgi:hypothetical protein